jgi:hypothetical protein
MLNDSCDFKARDVLTRDRWRRGLNAVCYGEVGEKR